ncbi:S8 family serine peptidase [Hoylesella loescheii]|uniref:S8 family serine peptidase n=1 Tax=Hoylesella loescheii TaxID=840 RepID=UPI0026EBE76D|nr:S8 family serine peptidase [Hoylesella loescheii]
MKSILLLISLLFAGQKAEAQYGYNYNGQFISLAPDNTSVTYLETKGMDISTLQAKTRTLGTRGVKWIKVSQDGFMADVNAEKAQALGYVSKQYRSSTGGKVIVLPRILVSLIDSSLITTFLAENKQSLTLDKKIGDMYRFACHAKNSTEVLALIANLAKRIDVKWCEPDMLSDYKTDNPLYSWQYYLKNTGQSGGKQGIDINIEPAWESVQGGSDVVVAVIDTGVDNNHEDMQGCVLNGYTAGGNNSAGAPINPSEKVPKAHGICCAGIIGALNNNVGIRGIASGVKILPVNIFPHYASIHNRAGAVSSSEIASAIYWAYPKADVLSCSWGGGSFSNAIVDAINSAQKHGREGKGTVVVFSSGNKNEIDLSDSLSFPGSLKNVLTVGAIDNKGEKSWYSKFGSALNVVAPGDDIVTLDRMGSLGYSNGNYMYVFGGTSAACPQVAGIAALMISKNRELTEKQIREIIQNTARDLGDKGFDIKYGHGLVDAAAAINAVPFQIYGDDYLCDESVYYIRNIPDDKSYSVQWEIHGQYVIPSMMKIDESGRLCTLIKNKYLPFRQALELKAKLLRNNHIIAELSKQIIKRAKVTGTYEQEACHYYNAMHPKITPKELEDKAHFVHQGCEVTLKLRNVEGQKVRYEEMPGCKPDYFMNLSDKVIFRLPKGTGGIPFYVTITDEKGCDDCRFLFFTASGNEDLPPDCLSIGQEGKIYHISLVDNKALNSGQTNAGQGVKMHSIQTREKATSWKVEVYNTKTAHKVYEKYVAGESVELDATNLEKGVYIINAVQGDNSYTKKIRVE